MVRYTKWCLNDDCGRKQVFYNPLSDSRYYPEKKPFVCSICKTRFSYEDMDLKRGTHNSQYKPKYSLKVERCCKILRELNRKVKA